MNDQSQSNPSVLHLVRITIEATSPLTLGSGDLERITRPNSARRDASAEAVYATSLVRDANGLPTIPGTTMQGVLRRWYEAAWGREEAESLFGYGKETTGQAGRLIVGFGLVHDCDDNAVDNLVEDAGRIMNDPILRLLRGSDPLLRDHVGLNHRHVADGRKKFIRRAVPIGTRFSLELSLWGGVKDVDIDRTTLLRIVSLFRHPVFRLGGAGRHGYGQIVLQRASYVRVNLDDPIWLRTLRRQAPSVVLDDPAPIDAVTFNAGVTLKVCVTPINPWRIGGAADYLTKNTHGVRRAAGDAPVVPGANTRQTHDAEDVATIAREPVIIWENSRAALRQPTATSPFDLRMPNGVAFPAPGSAIKGPLVHRTQYHWNRFRTDISGMIDVNTWLAWDEAAREGAIDERARRPASLARLFGAAKQRNGAEGRAGRAFVPDGKVEAVQAVQARDHIVIDRFAGGVIPELLYAEEVLVGGTITLAVSILPDTGDDGAGMSDWPEDVRRAFLNAVRDLCRGRLAFGAKSLGFCQGDITAWDGDEAMIASWRSTWEEVLLLPARRDAA